MLYTSEISKKDQCRFMDIEENTNEQFHGIIEPVEIDHEMRTAYID